jgi:hypothetical protein
MKRWRQYLSSAGATIAVFMMVGLAFAGPGEVPEEASDKAKEVQSSKAEKTKEPKANETVGAEAEVEGEGEDVVNHGHCVSYWAHKSKEDGLKGRARGQFISSIAQDEEAVSKKVEDGSTPDSTCNFQGQLDQAKAEAAQAATTGGRGKGKAKGKGKPDTEEGS